MAFFSELRTICDSCDDWAHAGCVGSSEQLINEVAMSSFVLDINMVFIDGLVEE